MSEKIVDDYSNVTVKIKEDVAIKMEVDSDLKDSTILLSDFVPDEQGNVLEFDKDETRFIKAEPIEGGPTGSSNISDVMTSGVRVKSLDCPECGKTFSYKSKLNVHIAGVHLKLKKFPCGECELAFTIEANLKRHLDSIHRKLKEYACGKCHRAFTRKGNLAKHLEAIHKLKRFECGECDRAFTDASNLKRHVQAVHHKLKRFVCGECDHTFSQKSHLKKHLVAIHKEIKSTGEGNFVVRFLRNKR